MREREKIINEEITEKLAEGMGCILFDFGCYFPYANSEILEFDFQLGSEILPDKKMNHRWPNKGYQTISRKYGRKVSKTGYPYFFKLDDCKEPILLTIKVGIKEKGILTLIFPLLLTVTEENPVCSLRLRFYFDKMTFDFISDRPTDDGIGWYDYHWSNEEPAHPDFFKNSPEQYNVFSNPTPVNDSTLLYKEVITPFAAKANQIYCI